LGPVACLQLARWVSRGCRSFTYTGGWSGAAPNPLTDETRPIRIGGFCRTGALEVRVPRRLVRLRGILCCAIVASVFRPSRGPAYAYVARPRRMVFLTLRQVHGHRKLCAVSVPPGAGPLHPPKIRVKSKTLSRTLCSRNDWFLCATERLVLQAVMRQTRALCGSWEIWLKRPDRLFPSRHHKGGDHSS